jgi:serine protease Do
MGSSRTSFLQRSAVIFLAVSIPLVALSRPSDAADPVTAPTTKPLDTADEQARLYDEVAAEYQALERQINHLKKVVRVVRRTVVHLESTKIEPRFGNFAGPQSAQPTVEEAGSGIVIEMNSVHYVLTNRHVVRDAPLGNITIRLQNGRMLKPEQVWTDADTDVAVIQVKGDSSLLSARLGDSDELEIGDFVLAVGSPFGLSHSVSYGIVSAKGRRDLELGTEYVRLQDFLQTDAAVNPGNSGGPLINLRGEVVGINTAIASSSGGNEGVSFAIPINLVMFVTRQLVTRGEVDHAYLGVQLDSDFDLPKAATLGLDHVRGALVKGVTPRSPAYFANLQGNDLITRFDGKIVEDDDHLVNLVSVTPINQTVTLEIVRAKARMEAHVKVGNRKHFEPREEQ